MSKIAYTSCAMLTCVFIQFYFELYIMEGKAEENGEWRWHLLYFQWFCENFGGNLDQESEYRLLLRICPSLWFFVHIGYPNFISISFATNWRLSEVVKSHCRIYTCIIGLVLGIFIHAHCIFIHCMLIYLLLL